MSVLALKALDYGADKLPDRIFEAIPGGFFTPDHKRHPKSKTKRRPLRDTRGKSEQRDDRGRRRSQRERTPPSEYSGRSSDDDSYHERDQRRQGRRRRVQSLGRSLSRSVSRSLSRGRHQQRSSGFDGEYDDRAQMDRGPQFPPPPTSEYRPYNPQEYASPPPGSGGQYDPYRRAPSATQDHGYPPQPTSQTAARYTPGAGYAPSPVNVNAPILPAPNNVYAPYNPADYTSSNVGYPAPGNTYPSPPPFYRQSSRSQPSLAQYPHPNNQVAAYDSPPDRHGSSSSSRRHRHKDDRRHRARSASQHGRSRSRVTDKFRDRFEGIDLHDKNLAASVGGALAGGLAGRAVGHGGTLSTLIGAGIGAFGGREFEKRLDKQKTGRSESQAREPRGRSPSRSRSRGGYSRSPSRDRRRKDRYSADSYSDSESDSRQAARRRQRHSRSRRDPEY